MRSEVRIRMQREYFDCIIYCIYSTEYSTRLFDLLKGSSIASPDIITTNVKEYFSAGKMFHYCKGFQKKHDIDGLKKGRCKRRRGEGEKLMNRHLHKYTVFPLHLEAK